MPLRKLVIDGAIYRVGVTHAHDVLPPPAVAGARGRCRERFTAYLEGYTAAPLRIHLTDGEGRGAGYPERGVVWIGGGPSLNLNLPAVAAMLVRRARASGWEPTTMRRPFILDDGFALFVQPA